MAAERERPNQPARDYDIGILLVHGIGNQRQGATLTDFGNPLIAWLSDRAASAGARVEIAEAILKPGGDDPATAVLRIHTPENERRWLLAESWWAEAFPIARFSDVAKWGLAIVPWTIGAHFAKRLSTARDSGHEGPSRLLSLISAAATFVAGLLLSPLLLLWLSGLLLLGRMPIPQLRAALARLQSPIASSLGDCYMLVTRRVEAAAIRSRVRADLEWLARRCGKVAVVAHSQGAAIAAHVVAETPAGTGLLVTFGSGLRKLEELTVLQREKAIVRAAGLTVAGLVATALSVATTPALALQAYEGSGTASPASLLTLLLVGAAGVLVAAAGTADFMQISEPATLQAMAERLDTSHVEWVDIYSSADPVPNGTVRDGGACPPHSSEVVNLGSIWRDHTAYWNNRDGFVALVGDRLIAFDSHILPPLSHAATAFVQAQRRVRIDVLRAIAWVTGVSVMASLVRHRTDWLRVLSWASHRSLAAAASLIGWTMEAAAMPGAAVWQQSVGWLLLFLLANGLSRWLWDGWNARAMDQAQRGAYRTDEPIGLLMSFWLQAALAVIAVSGHAEMSGWLFGGSFAATVVLMINISLHQPRQPALPPTSTDGAAPPTRAESAWTLLKNLFLAGVLIIGVPAAWFSLAGRALQYLVPRWGRMPGWLAAGVMILLGVSIDLALIRGLMITDKASAAHARSAPPADAPLP